MYFTCKYIPSGGLVCLRYSNLGEIADGEHLEEHVVLLSQSRKLFLLAHDIDIQTFYIQIFLFWMMKICGL